MKKFLFSSILFVLFSCDDGDLQIETLDFDSATIQFCTTIVANEPNLLFKLNDSEALILQLPAGSIKNEPTTDAIQSNVSANGPSQIIYRTFSDNVTRSYFCSAIPLTDPTVIEEIIAEGGTVSITTVLSADGSNYEHTIELSEISLLTSENSRITNLSINNFGSVVTPVE